jgi:nicotinamide-nucleotide amidase
MSVLLLSVGDEILDGRILNSNAQWMGDQLRSLRVPVREIRSISDKPEHIRKTLLEAGKFKLVVATGGLGPTNDDRTMSTAAAAFKLPLVLNAKALSLVRRQYQKRSLELTESRRKLAFLPKGAKVLMNQVGTAPGALIVWGSTTFIFLPGPPNECHPMFTRFVTPIAKKLCSGRKLVARKTWRLFGKGESDIYQAISPEISELEKKFPDSFQFGIHINFPCIDLTLETWRIGSKAIPTARDLRSLLEKIESQLGSLLISRKKESLAEVVMNLLKERGATLSLAESCTGGWVGKILTDIPGSSQVLLGGVVAYANSAKEKTLGVSPEILRGKGAVSGETAQAMAEGALSLFRSTYALALSGVSGPGGGSEKKPVGTLQIGLAGPSGSFSEHHWVLKGAGTREQNRLVSVYLALDALRKTLQAKA